MAIRGEIKSKVNFRTNDMQRYKISSQLKERQLH